MPQASVKILSKSTLDLLNECGLRWRVSPAFRWLQYLDAIKSRYDSSDSEISSQINYDHIKEGFHLLNESIKRRPIDTWTIFDVCIFYLFKNLSEFHKQIFIMVFYDTEKRTC